MAGPQLLPFGWQHHRSKDDHGHGYYAADPDPSQVRIGDHGRYYPLQRRMLTSPVTFLHHSIRNADRLASVAVSPLVVRKTDRRRLN